MAAPERAPERVVLLRPRTVLTVLGVTLLVALALTLVYLAWKVITWILIAAFLAIALNPAVEFFERRRIRRGLAAAFVFVLALAAVTGLGLIFIPPLVRNIVEFVEAIPSIVEELSRGRGPLGFLERRYDIVERVRGAVGDGGVERVLGLGAPAFELVRGVVVGVVGLVAVIFLTFFMLLEGRRWTDRFLDLVPEASRPRWRRIGHGVYRSIGGFVTGALVVALIAGTSATIVLLILGVDFAFALGLLVAVLGLIPLAGATLSAIILTTVTFAAEGPLAGVIVLVYFVLYQQLENHVVLPVVYGRTVRLSPLAVLVAVLVGAELAGIIGALVAIPIAGSIQVIIAELVSWRRERATATVA